MDIVHRLQPLTALHAVTKAEAIVVTVHPSFLIMVVVIATVVVALGLAEV